MDELYSSYINKIVGETLNCAVMNNGCTKIVCGTSWWTLCLETLSVEDRGKDVEKDSPTKYKFGYG